MFSPEECYEMINGIDDSIEESKKIIELEKDKILKGEATKKAIEELYYVTTNAKLLLNQDSKEYVVISQSKNIKENVKFAEMLNTELERLCNQKGIEYQGTVTMQGGVRVIRTFIIPKYLLTEKQDNMQTKKSHIK